MKFFNSFALSWRLLIQSIGFLNNNRDLIFFPIISIIATTAFLALTVFSGILAFPLFEHLNNLGLGLGIVTIAIIYFILSFIIIYFNASLIACATLRLQGKEAAIGDGLELAAKHWWTLVQWSIISTTVGFIIRALENSHNIVEDIIGLILGLTWTIGAFFVIPVLIFEDVGPFSALKRGFSIFGRGWRKVLSIHIIFGLFGLAIYGILYGLFYFMPNETKTIIEIGVVLFVLIVIFMATVGSAFNAIVTSALYLNIMQKQEPQGFDKDMLASVFQKRKRISRFS